MCIGDDHFNYRNPFHHTLLNCTYVVITNEAYFNIMSFPRGDYVALNRFHFFDYRYIRLPDFNESLAGLNCHIAI